MESLRNQSHGIGYHTSAIISHATHFHPSQRHNRQSWTRKYTHKPVRWCKDRYPDESKCERLLCCFTGGSSKPPARGPVCLGWSRTQFTLSFALYKIFAWGDLCIPFVIALVGYLILAPIDKNKLRGSSEARPLALWVARLLAIVGLLLVLGGTIAAIRVVSLSLLVLIVIKFWLWAVADTLCSAKRRWTRIHTPRKSLVALFTLPRPLKFYMM